MDSSSFAFGQDHYLEEGFGQNLQSGKVYL